MKCIRAGLYRAHILKYRPSTALKHDGLASGRAGLDLTRKSASGAPLRRRRVAAGEGEPVAVKSADDATAAAQLRREGEIMASLSSPHVLPCLGFRAAAGGEF